MFFLSYLNHDTISKNLFQNSFLFDFFLFSKSSLTTLLYIRYFKYIYNNFCLSQSIIKH